MITCCGVEMTNVDDWYHCTICGVMLRLYHRDEECEPDTSEVID